MKTLLYKQLRLVCHPMTPVFCLFGFMVIIPNYPYTVIFFYVMLGLFFTFLNMREQKDLYYTALLPVPKRDAVKAGCLFTALIELLSLAVLVPCALLAVEALPGQYDQRADSCAQCIQMMHGGERPTVRAATVYVLEGALTTPEAAKARGYLINPVDTREASMDKPSTLKVEYAIPTSVASVVGFTHMDEAALSDMLHHMGLAMDLADLAFLQAYFRDEEGRDPTLTEVRVVDTYWSDHCRHTTFSTHLDEVEIADDNVKAAYERYLSARVEVYGAEKAAKRPQTLMDIATIGCAAAVRLDGTVISGIRLAYSVSAPIPVRCPGAEAAAWGRSVTPEDLPATLAAISAAVEADVQPRTSWRANRDFRMHIIRTLAERVIARCVVRAVELQEAASC